MLSSCCFFFFQAEDGIRDKLVTGVQTCALPISTELQLLPPSVLLKRLSPLVPTYTVVGVWGSTARARILRILSTLTGLQLLPPSLLLKRSEEHTSELQSLAYLVCRLLLEKKKNRRHQH